MDIDTKWRFTFWPEIDGVFLPRIFRVWETLEKVKPKLYIVVNHVKNINHKGIFYILPNLVTLQLIM